MFIIDSSRSVRPSDYEKVKIFITNILAFLDVGPEATRVGLLQYGSVVQNEFSLNTYSSKVAWGTSSLSLPLPLPPQGCCNVDELPEQNREIYCSYSFYNVFIWFSKYKNPQ